MGAGHKEHGLLGNIVGEIIEGMRIVGQGNKDSIGEIPARRAVFVEAREESLVRLVVENLDAPDTVFPLHVSNEDLHTVIRLGVGLPEADVRKEFGLLEELNCFFADALAQGLDRFQFLSRKVFDG